MSAVPARDLRNHYSELLNRVQAGEEIEVLQNNRPVAKIIPIRGKRRWVPGRELAAGLDRLGPDVTGLSRQLDELLTDTTDDLTW